jgi:hypothetical protein
MGPQHIVNVLPALGKTRSLGKCDQDSLEFHSDELDNVGIRTDQSAS